MQLIRKFLVCSEYVVTMDDNMNVIYNGAVVINDDKIIDIGEKNDMLRKHDIDRVIEKKKGIIFPALINTHTHSAMVYLRGIADDLPLMEWLQNYIWPAEKKYVDKEFIKNAIDLANLEMIKSGTAVWNDSYFFQKIAAENTLKAGLRAFLGEGILDFPTNCCENPDIALKYTEEMLQEYKNNEFIYITLAPHSIYACNKEYLIKAKELARKYNALYHIHMSETEFEVNQSKKINNCTPFEFLNSIDCLDDYTIAAHCVWLSENDIKIMSEKKVNVAHCPHSNLKLASGIAPIVQLINNNINVSLATDGAASNNNLDLFREGKTAALIHKMNNSDPTVLNAETLCKMLTINGAKALKIDKICGSLEIGKKADLIVIDTEKAHLQPISNPYSHIAYSVCGGDVSHLIVNGKIIMEDRNVLTLNEDEILDKAYFYGKLIRK